MKFRTSHQFLARLANRRATRLLRTAALLTFSSISAAHAATYYWDPGLTGTGTGSGGTGTWNATAANWYLSGTGDTTWPGVGNAASFNGTAGTVTLGSAITADTVAFNVGGYTYLGNGNTLTLAAGTNVAGAGSTLYAGAGTTNIIGTISITGNTATGNPQYFYAASGATLNLSGSITQTNNTTASLYLAGGGTINYTNAASSFAPGKFVIQGGTTFNSSANMTITAGSINTGVEGGSTWNILGGAISDTATLYVGNGTGSNGTLNISAGSASFAAINAGSRFDGGTGAGADSTATITVNGGTLLSAGTVKLGSTFSGVGTLNLNGGTFSAGGTFAVGTGASGTGGSSTINFNGGTLSLTGTASTSEIAAVYKLQVGTGGAIVSAGNNHTILAPFVTNATADGGLTKLGAGTLTLSGNNTYNGATVIGNINTAANGGGIALNSTTTINASSSYTISGNNSQLLLDNTALTTSPSPDRLKDTATVTVSNSGEFRFNNSSTAGVSLSETIGTLALGTGTGIVTLSNSAASTGSVIAGSFSRGSNLATGLVRGTSLGNSGNNTNTRFLLTSTTGLTQIGTSTSTTGTEGTSKNLTIVPYLIGASAISSTGTEFVTYDTTGGFRRLGDNEQSLISAAVTGDNVKAAAGTTTVTGPVVWNSLLLNGGGTAATPVTAATTITGSDTLTLTSGALASVAANGAAGTGSVSGFSSIIFGTTGANEAIVTNTNSTGALTISSPIDTFAAGGGLTKAGAGNLVLTAANLYTGQTTINQGTLTIGNGTVGGGSLAAGSGTVTITPAGTLALVQPAGTTFANNIVNNGTLSITNAGSLTLSGAISGVSGVTQATTGTTLVLSGNDSYSGATTVSAGTLTLSGNKTTTGATNLSAGVLNVNSNAALGSGLFTIAGGTLDNTSGAAVTGQANNPAVTITNAFTYGGTNSLSVGSGVVAVASDRTITLNGNNRNTLSFGRIDNTRADTGINITVNNATNVSGETVAFDGYNLALNAFSPKTSILSGTGNILITGAIANGNAFANSLSVQTTGLSILTGTSTFTGGTTISNNGFLQLGNGGTTGSLSTTGNVQVNSGSTFIINRSNAISQATSFGTITNAGTVIVTGTGATTFTNANTYTGATTVNHGTLNLDFNASGAPASNIVSTSSALAMGGTSTLNILAKSNTATSQTFSATALNSGAATIAVSPAAVNPNAVVLNLAAITRNTGGTINFTLPPGTQNNTYGIRTTTANTATSILGGWATAGLNDWAVSGGTGTAAGNITALSTYFVSDDVANLSNNTANGTSNVTDNNGYNATYTNSLTINSLRFNANGSDSNFGIVSGQNLTLNSGGILVTTNVGAKYQRIGFLNTNFNAGEGQGTITSASNDLVIHQNNSGSGHLEIYSIVTGNIGLTKSGAGYLELRGLDANYTGATTVNAGTMRLTAATTATTSLVINNTGTLLLAGNNRINDAAAVTLNAGTLNLGGFSEGAAGTSGVGALTLAYTSTLDFGTQGTSNLIQFAGLGTHALGTLLQITDWESIASGSNNSDRLLFAGTSTAFTAIYGQSDVSFNGILGYGVTDFGSYYEVYGLGVTPVPEPATWAAGFLTLGVAGWHFRRRKAPRAA